MIIECLSIRLICLFRARTYKHFAFADIMAEDTAETSDTLNISELNALVDEHVRNGEHKTALFWAEKRLALYADCPLIQRLPEIANFLDVRNA